MKPEYLIEDDMEWDVLTRIRNGGAPLSFRRTVEGFYLSEARKALWRLEDRKILIPHVLHHSWGSSVLQYSMSLEAAYHVWRKW